MCGLADWCKKISLSSCQQCRSVPRGRREGGSTTGRTRTPEGLHTHCGYAVEFEGIVDVSIISQGSGVRTLDKGASEESDFVLGPHKRRIQVVFKGEGNILSLGHFVV